jgi:hypothetical protein
VYPDASPASALRPLWSGRKDLVDARGRLGQQAGALVDCRWPRFSAADSRPGSPRCSATPSTPRPAGWWWGGWPRAGPGPHRRHPHGRAAHAVWGPGLPAVAAGGQPAARPGRLGAACSSGRHRRQAGHPGRPAGHAGCPGSSDRRPGGRDGPAAGPHPGRQAHPDPRGGHRRHGWLGRVRGPHRALGGVVQGVASSRDGSRPQPSGATDASDGISPEGSAWGEGRPWTWQPASGVNRDAGETATEPAPSPGTSTPSPPWPPPATRSDGPCLP